jgi:prolyl-tRNA synthetase
MKDAYSFDVDAASARHSYNRMFVAYLRTFARMGLKAIPMRADTGPIGGDLSHEFIILAETGESAVHVDREFLEQNLLDLPVDYEDVAGLQAAVDRFTSYYAATDEMHDPAAAARLGDRLVGARGIEVGHIFYFGTKYSAAMGLTLQGPGGDKIVPEMGSYGIGVSRLVAAVAPFGCGIVNLRVGDAACDAMAGDLYAKLKAAGLDPLYDDRSESAGAKFATMDLIGLPWQLVVGPRGAKAGTVEVKDRRSGAKEEATMDAAIARLAAR